MKKIKFFISLLKERDWLEEMAAQGWLLTNIEGGIVYYFEKSEPCEKVFEIERFAITGHPDVATLTAKERAFDIISQFGWEEVTHDEDMNYYFMKDKAGDETDEFYDDEESRSERAERYRKHFLIEQPRDIIGFEFFVSLLYVFLIFALRNNDLVRDFLMWIYLIVTALEIAIIYGIMNWGEKLCMELGMSRKEWELHKKYNEKRRFKKVQQLRSFLQEKSEFGLSLKGYENGYYTFEEDSERYNYFIDTKGNLKKRLKEKGDKLNEDKKDWLIQSLNWYESSIAHAKEFDLKPVAVIGKSAIVYKRPYSDKALPWENGNENLNFIVTGKGTTIFLICCFIIGFIIGIIIGISILK